MRRFKNKRNANGYYLIETLVAIVLGALVAFALLQILVETIRLTSINSNKQSTDLMSQSVLDSIKAVTYQQYASLQPPGTPYPYPTGTYDLLPFGITPGQVGPSIHPLPAGIDMGDLTWIVPGLPATASVNNRKFPGTISVTLSAAPDPVPSSQSQIAASSVSWSDSGSLTGKTVSTQTIVHSRGINFWPLSPF